MTDTVTSRLSPGGIVYAMHATIDILLPCNIPHRAQGDEVLPLVAAAPPPQLMQLGPSPERVLCVADAAGTIPGARAVCLLLLSNTSFARSMRLVQDFPSASWAWPIPRPIS